MIRRVRFWNSLMIGVMEEIKMIYYKMEFDKFMKGIVCCWYV